MTTTATGETLKDAATGISITVPDRYRLRQVESERFAFAAEITLRRAPSFPPAETTTGCLATVTRFGTGWPGPRTPTRQELDARWDSPDVKDGFVATFANRYRITRQADVMIDGKRAFEIEGEPAGAPEQLVYAAGFFTMTGQVTLSCGVWPPDWRAMRADFHTLAAGVSAP